MSINQLHGKKIEDLIKSCFPGASDKERTTTSTFDIEYIYDKEKKLNTSIKSKKKAKNNNELIELADARRIFSLNEDFRLLLCLYSQNGTKKSFNQIIEYVVKKENLDILKNNLSYNEVEGFHNQIKSFKVGFHKEARKFSRLKKKELSGKSLISLNPKIDSKRQRRLQCSIRRNVLESILKPDQIIVHHDEFKDLCLPISIISGSRIFKK